jgi:hypothetical protein
MKKLINIQFIEAEKGVFCLSYRGSSNCDYSWDEMFENHPENPSIICKQDPSAMYDILFPKYKVVITLEDGETYIGGIQDVTSNTAAGMWYNRKEFDLYWNFTDNSLYDVSVAQAIVRGLMYKNPSSTEDKEKIRLYKELIVNRIILSSKVEEYLIN